MGADGTGKEKSPQASANRVSAWRLGWSTDHFKGTSFKRASFQGEVIATKKLKVYLKWRGRRDCLQWPQQSLAAEANIVHIERDTPDNSNGESLRYPYTALKESQP